MRILFIDPPFYRIIGFYNRYFPLGLVSVATYLQERGHDVAVYDADYNENPESIDYSKLPDKYNFYLASFSDENSLIWSEAKKTIQDFKPEIVGISIWTTYAASSFFLARLVKEINKNCIVVLGGPHANVRAEEILKISKDVDYVIRGEGEEAMINLINNRIEGVPLKENINGLSFRGNNSIFHNPRMDIKKDLNIYPIPDRSLLLNEKRYTSEDMGLIMTSRGCPFSCSFCATYKRVISFRSPENILKEIRYVKEKYNTRQFAIKDDSFTVNIKRIKKFCDLLINERLNINWQCNTRVNLVDEELLRYMKKSGCNGVSIGIESGSEKILKKMNKGITLDQISRAVKLLKKSGIPVTGYFMIGVPGETEEDIFKTIALLKDLKTDFASIGVYEPFPGTVMFNEGIERGLINDNMTLEDFYSIMPNNYYRKIPVKYIDTIENQRFLEIEAWVKYVINKYNTNIFRLLKMVRSRLRTYLENPKTLINDFKKFLSYRKNLKGSDL